MKVLIQGTLVDLTMITHISQINKDTYCSEPLKNVFNYPGASFNIFFIGNSELTVGLVYKVLRIKVDTNQYRLELKEETVTRLQKAHDELVTMWQGCEKKFVEIKL